MRILEVKLIKKIYYLIILVLVIAVVCFVAVNKNSYPTYIRECVSAGESVTRLKQLESGNVVGVYLVRDSGGTPVRMLQIVEEQGFKGMIKMRVSIDCQEKKLLGVAILEHHETDHYGGYAAEDWFLERFSGKGTSIDLQVVKLAEVEPGDIVSVTGATITSQGIVTGVNKTLSVFREYEGGVK